MKAKAKTINGDVIEGHYFYDVVNASECIYSTEDITIGAAIKIDPTTLEYQVGSEWYSEYRLLNLVVKGLKLEFTEG